MPRRRRPGTPRDGPRRDPHRRRGRARPGRDSPAPRRRRRRVHPLRGARRGWSACAPPSAPEPAARLHAEHVDVTDEAALGGFVQRRARRLGRHRHPGQHRGRLRRAATSPRPRSREWRRLMDLNLTSVVVACRGVLPAMTARALRADREHRLARGARPVRRIHRLHRGQGRGDDATQALAQEVRAQRHHGERGGRRAPWTRPATARPCPTPTGRRG